MHEAVGDHECYLSFNGRIDEGTDGQERLTRICVGVDSHLLVLLILFPQIRKTFIYQYA